MVKLAVNVKRCAMDNRYMVIVRVPQKLTDGRNWYEKRK